jgi:hypothetical protein
VLTPGQRTEVGTNPVRIAELERAGEMPALYDLESLEGPYSKVSNSSFAWGLPWSRPTAFWPGHPLLVVSNCGMEAESVSNLGVHCPHLFFRPKCYHLSSGMLLQLNPAPRTRKAAVMTRLVVRREVDSERGSVHEKRVYCRCLVLINSSRRYTFRRQHVWPYSSVAGFQPGDQE